jgi:UDP-2-acetamido-3-amino-2,3-dideoxy-glucuronate N-acetyltransferase
MTDSLRANASIGPDCIIPASAIVEDGVLIGPRVILNGENIVIHAHAVIEAGCILGEGVTIGTNSLIRAGAIVLESVPANSIVEGNPARVTGFRHIIANKESREAIDASLHNRPFNNTRPFRHDLGVGDSSLYFMRSIRDARGALTVGEVPNEIPFDPKRYFVIYDVPSLELRGEHAHKECNQFLICVNGSCKVMVDDGAKRTEVILDSPDVGLYLPKMIWGTQYCYSTDAVLLVFASHPYDSGDYIRTYADFILSKGR